VMAAPVISISLNVSVESVRSSFPLVNLIGSISVKVLVAPEVGAAAVASPTGVLELDTHSLSEADPSESSPPLVYVAPMVSPFLCSDDSESDIEIPERHVSPTTFTLEIPTTPILPAPFVIVAPSSEYPLAPIIIESFIFRSFIIWAFYFGSFFIWTYTTDVDTSTPPRFVHRSLTRTLRRSEAFRHWRSAPLSTPYPSTTSESSLGSSSERSLDSSSPSSGPSRKRCRSPTATVTSSIHATRALVPSRAYLLPPCKRFRDSISPEDSVEEDIDTDVLEDIEADVTAVKVAVDRDIEARVDAGIDMEVDVGDDVEDKVESSDRGNMEVGVDLAAGIDIPDVMLMPDVVECLEQVEEGLQDIYDHVIEIPLQRIEDIEMGQRELESRSLIAGGERASLLEQVASLERINVSLRGTMMMEGARANRFWRRVRPMES
ncbi:hypothetical protein Tco_1480533, partial [Tanacetum coccineum]